MRGAVLIVDDNKQHRQVYAAALRANGYEPIEIIDEREAVAIAQVSQAVAIIVDIKLPYIDGRKIISHIRLEDATRDTPIMAVSAFPDYAMEETCLSAGANCFHSKPLRLQTLVSEIAGLTSGRSGHVQS